MSIRITAIFLGFVGAGCLVHAEAPQGNTVSSGGLEFVFATAEQGRHLLGRRDEYVDQMSPFDRQVRMQTAKDAGIDAFLEFVAAQVLPWPDPARQKVTEALQSLDGRLRELGIVHAAPVMLVYTTGRQESGASSTRGSTVVFSRKQIGDRRIPPRSLVAHELFHVISRGDLAQRDRLYEVIGFRPATPISLPGEWLERRITNPDAPAIEHVIDLKLGDNRSVTVAPVLFAKIPYDVEKKQGLFGYLSFRLMEVQQDDNGRWESKMVDNEPLFHSPSTPDFHRQIGSNTGYIIHPEEILADNFMLMLTGGKVKDRWLIEKMKKILVGKKKATSNKVEK